MSIGAEGAALRVSKLCLEVREDFLWVTPVFLAVNGRVGR